MFPFDQPGAAYAAIAIIAAGYIVFGLTGFGASLITIPVAWFIPAAALGLWIGSRLHVGISNEGMLRVLHLVMLACGLSLVLRVGVLGHS